MFISVLGIFKLDLSFMASSSSSEVQKKQLHACDDITSIKAFSESNCDVPIPSTYYSLSDDVADDDLAAASIPVLDFSLLTSQDPQIHADAVRQLANACTEWGFFMVTNHGISEKLMEEVINKSMEFHNLGVEEKMEFSNKELITPIRFGTSSLPYGEKVHYWRDYLKLTTFPDFHSPHKPPGFKDVVFEYNKRVREVARALLEGISESLGLEGNAIVEGTGFDLGHQTCQVNLYPPCPQPDLTLGLLAHSDNGLLTLLIDNGIKGLQVKHHGKWVNVNALPHCLLANIGDQLEIVSNKRYGSVWHRVVVNERDTRLSFAVENGAALDKEIGPAIGLMEKEKPLFKSIMYQQYLQLQQEARCVDKRGLDMISIHLPNSS